MKRSVTNVRLSAGLGAEVNMDLNAYHHALHLGFSEREATRIGEDAWEESRHAQAQRRPEPEAPRCDICCEYPAVTGVNGYGVCSETCYNEAMNKAPNGQANLTPTTKPEDETP